MATKLYDKDITKYIDWGGDVTTNGLPVSGEKIQKFIKEKLNEKFGYMYYDKNSVASARETGVCDVAEHSPSKQYLVFADKEDFALWAADPNNGAEYIRGRFEAPAPATIEVTDLTGFNTKTILLSDINNQQISFKYVVKDKAGNAQSGLSTINISINNNVSGNKVLPTTRKDSPDNADAGVTYTFSDLGKYLSEGTNTVNITITSLQHNVSTIVTYQFKVIDLKLSTSFNNPNSRYSFYNGIPKEDESFEINITASGAGEKYLRIFIDGQQVYLLDNKRNYVLDLYIGNSSPVNYDVTIPMIDKQGNYYEWTEDVDGQIFGKHNIQMYFFVRNETLDEIKSQTLYFDFALTEQGRHASYILFQRVFENNAFSDVIEEGQDASILPKGKQIDIYGEQYIQTLINYAVYDTSGRGNVNDGSAVRIDINLYGIDEGDDFETSEYHTSQDVPSGSSSTIDYTPLNYGNKKLVIQNTAKDGETFEMFVHFQKSSVQVESVTQGLVLRLSALNRSNMENEESRAKWEYKTGKVIAGNEEVISAQFNNVLWNTQNGWIDNCLVLNNNATVTIPLNIFSKLVFPETTGGTFEIEFETANVQEDDAIIMRYGDENGANITIGACFASLKSNNGNEIITNYKDGARQKIQFIYGSNPENKELASGDCPYLMYIVVNGILDRVTQFTSSDKHEGSTPAYAQFTIGNTEGKVTTKIRNITIYNRPLTLKECVNNFVADSDDVRGNHLRNDIYNDDDKTINVNKILSSDIHVPVMTIFGDFSNSIVQVFNKKANVPVDILYQDPMHPEFNYFARDAWLSNQGTSSMNYPRRNLRPYFNKEADSNTLRGYGSADRYKYETRVWWGLTDTDAITRIQQGQQDLDEPFVINDVTYKPLRNKKTLKKKPQTIDYGTAVMFVHSGIKIFSDSACKNAIKKLNEYVQENPDGEIWVQGAYARYKEKDLFTDRWTLKCDYAESSMTHNAGVGRLWNNVMRDVTVQGGFTYDNIEGERLDTTKPGATNAQRAMQAYDEAHKGQKITINGHEQNLVFGDIRTSCDGYPIIVINRPRLKDENNQYTEEYGNPIYMGLYNIMTDKGSTPLFGFEDLKDEDGTKIFDASNTECWECLQNGSKLAQMNDLITDDPDKTDGAKAPYTSQFDADGKFIEGTGSDNKDRKIFETYEARWPDNKDLNKTCTNNLETVIRFVNFCKDAVSVRVGDPSKDKDAYDLSDFTKIDDETAELWASDGTIDTLPNKTLYLSEPKMEPKEKTSNFYLKDSEGNIIYDDNTGKPVLIDKEVAKANIKNKVYYYQTYVSQVTTSGSGTMVPLYDETETNTELMINRIYEQLNSNSPHVYILEQSNNFDEVTYEPTEWRPDATDEIRHWYILDKTYDRTIVTKTINKETLKDEVYTGRVFTYDGKRRTGDGGQLHDNAWVTVYLTKENNKWKYVDEFGHIVDYNSGEEVIEEHGTDNIVEKTDTFKNKTKFQYFQDKKYEHFDVYKLACYYVYLMRFGAVDQVIKNTMMTTEDGKHYYFINYDNDTILGVRNDGYLAYDWQIDRETYDDSIGAYAYAGFGSVLWNTLEQDQDFMTKVQTVATAMASSNVLTYDIALDMFNVQQSGTWCENLYNESEMYKYIGTYNDLDNEGTASYNPYQNTRYLPFVQGSRASHRDWWLKHRFDLYDSKWGAGEYATAFMQVYYNIEASPSREKVLFTMKAASKFYFTVQDVHHITLNNNFVELNAGESWSPKTASSLAGVSDPIIILGAYNMDTLDFSGQRESLGESGIVISPNWTNEKYVNKIKRLILGGDTPVTVQDPCTIGAINGIDRFIGLEELDIRTCTKLTNIDLSSLVNLKKFLAEGSAIKSFTPAVGTLFDEISLPNTIGTLTLDGITIQNFNYTPNLALTKVTIKNVEGEAFEGNKLFDFVLNWYVTLKKSSAIISNFSCELAFNRIELEQYYGSDSGELAESVNDWINSIPMVSGKPNIAGATKKIKSFDLLNTIRKDFGLNANNEENFKLTSGVIKLYGDNYGGGLTEENYNYMITETFNGITKLWDEKTFRPDNAFHFDSNDSIFVTVSPYDDSYKVPVYDDLSYTYNIIAGQKVKINVTMFPVNDEREIIVMPYSPSASGSYGPWSKDTVTGDYFHKWSGGLISSLSNDNGTAVLDIYEYTDDTEKSIQIRIKEKIGDVEHFVEGSDFYVNIQNMVKPRNSDIIFYAIDDDGNTSNSPVSPQIPEEIKEIKEYRYKLGFIPSIASQINVDIASVNPSFNSTSVVSQNEYGTLSSELVDGEYIIKYVPNIQNNDTQIYLHVFVNLADRLNTQINNRISVNLDTKKIESIDVLSSQNVSLKDAETGEIHIHQFVKDISEIINVGNRKGVSYNYKVKINPDSYNVPIQSMEIILDDEIMTSSQISANKGSNNIIIESFDIKYTISRPNSVYDEDYEFTIKITDIYGNEISQVVHVEFGYFVPAGIKLLKQVGNSYDKSDQSENTILLSSESPIISYGLFVYSLVGTKTFIWGNTQFVQDIYAEELRQDSPKVKLLDDTQYPNATYGLLTFGEVGEFGDYCGQIVNTNNGYTGFQFPINSAYENQVWSASRNLRYSVSFNSIEATLDKDITVERTSAITTNFNYSNVPLNEVYFLDKRLNLYNKAGVMLALDHDVLVRSDIIGLIYVYQDINGVRRYTSLDPWKLTDDSQKGYIWWHNNSMWYNNGDGQNFGIQWSLGYLLENYDYVLNEIHEQMDILSLYEHYSEGYLFDIFYNYYRILCSQWNNVPENDGGSFELQTTVGSDYSLNPMPELTELCRAYHEGLIEFVEPSVITDNNMIFYYINDYRKMGLTNFVCKPLSLQDYQNIFSNFTKFEEALNVLEQDTLVNNLYNTLIYYVDNTEDNDHKTPDVFNENNGFDNIQNYENLKSSKIFWYFSIPTSNTMNYDSEHGPHDAWGARQRHVQVYYDKNEQKFMVVPHNLRDSNTYGQTYDRLEPNYPMFCLFGPSQAVRFN